MAADLRGMRFWYSQILFLDRSSGDGMVICRIKNSESDIV